MSLGALLFALFPTLLAPAGPCEPIAPPLYACADGRAHTLDTRGWRDAGPLAPFVIRVPALPER